MSDLILVAVSDSPAAFLAAEAAIAHARAIGAAVRAMTVIPEGDPTVRPAEVQADAAELARSADAALAHVVLLAEAAGVEVSSVRRTGRIAAEILAEARAAQARLIVMARVDRPGHAIPSVGSHTLRVLEFSTVPVLVVPDPSGHHHAWRQV